MSKEGSVMWRKIVIGLLVVVGGLLAFVAVKSPEYEITREIAINASAEKIFPYLNNSKLGEQWGPWLDIDPATKMTYAGPDEGVGSVASWTGGAKLGTGSATIVESVANQRVGIKIEYTEPMVMVQDSEYLLAPQGEGQLVTWRVKGTNSFVGRLMCLFMDMDKEVGGMFDKGLEKLKALVEK
jgi:hypothetical protein